MTTQMKLDGARVVGVMNAGGLTHRTPFLSADLVIAGPDGERLWVREYVPVVEGGVGGARGWVEAVGVPLRDDDKICEVHLHGGSIPVEAHLVAWIVTTRNVLVADMIDETREPWRGESGVKLGPMTWPLELDRDRRYALGEAPGATTATWYLVNRRAGLRARIRAAQRAERATIAALARGQLGPAIEHAELAFALNQFRDAKDYDLVAAAARASGDVARADAFAALGERTHPHAP